MAQAGGLPIPTHVSQISSGRSSESEAVAPPPSQPLEPHRCERPACSVNKVFETTELLEHILTFIPTRQILLLQRTSKKWNMLIRESPALRLHCFVEPQWQLPGSRFELLPLALTGLNVRRGSPVHLGQWIEIDISPDAVATISKQRKQSRQTARSPAFFYDFEDRDAAPIRQTASLPPNPNDLMISRPPLTNMQAFLVPMDNPAATTTGGSLKTADTGHGEVEESSNAQNSSSSEVPSAHSKIACDAGVTLGFMADVAENLLKKTTDKHVVFKAIISFCSQSDAAPGKRSNNRWVTKIE